MIQSQADGLRAHYSNKLSIDQSSSKGWQNLRNQGRLAGIPDTRPIPWKTDHQKRWNDPESFVSTFLRFNQLQSVSKKAAFSCSQVINPEPRAQTIEPRVRKPDAVDLLTKTTQITYDQCVLFFIFHYFGVGTRWHLEHFNHRREDATFSVY